MINILKRLEEAFKLWAKEIWAYKYYLLLSLLIVALANYVNYTSGVYTTSGAKVMPSPDLILDNFGPYDLSFIFVYGYIAFFSIMVLYPLFFRVRMLHSVIIQLAFLTMLRSFFISLTHLRVPLDAVAVHFPFIFGKIQFQNDMFFSGHVAFIFLGFWLFKGKNIRYLFLVGSVVFAIVALAMHRHYSIDVFAAFFICYCSYVLGEKFLAIVERRKK